MIQLVGGDDVAQAFLNQVAPAHIGNDATRLAYKMQAPSRRISWSLPLTLLTGIDGHRVRIAKKMPTRCSVVTGVRHLSRLRRKDAFRQSGVGGHVSFVAIVVAGVVRRIARTLERRSIRSVRPPRGFQLLRLSQISEDQRAHVST
jgi:hypothetical protein